MNDYTYKYNVYKKANYMIKLYEKFQMALISLDRKVCVKEFYVSMGCNVADAEGFKRQETVFLKLINMAFGKKKEENLEKVPFTIESDPCFNVKTFVVEYSGAEEDEDIARTFLMWLDVIGKKELMFRAHPLDDRKRPLKLTNDEDHGVLALNQWDRANRLIMDPKFYLEAPIDKWMDFRTLRRVNNQPRPQCPLCRQDWKFANPPWMIVHRYLLHFFLSRCQMIFTSRQFFVFHDIIFSRNFDKLQE